MGALSGSGRAGSAAVVTGSPAPLDQTTRGILDTIADGVVVFDAAFFVRFANREAKRLFGDIEHRSLETFVKGLVSLTTAKRLEDSAWPPRRALREGVRAHAIVSWERFDGDPLPLEVVATPLRSAGTSEGVVMTLRDIAPRLALERELREFIAITSHQFRTPLSGVAWLLEVVLSGRVGELSREQWRMVQQAREATRELIDTVRLILDAARIELGVASVTPKPHNIGKLIGEEVDRMKIFAERKRQSMTLSVPRTLPEIPVDETVIRLVLMNLLSNAVKYTSEGGAIGVKVVGESHRVRVSVTDNGVGIPKNDQERIFTKFFRARNVFMESGGTGLGLYVVKLLLDRVGGEVWFESDEGKGATFTFTIPRAGHRSVEGTTHLESPARPLY